MNCKKCGAMLRESDKFCINCGTPVESTNNEVINTNNEFGVSVNELNPTINMDNTQQVREQNEAVGVNDVQQVNVPIGVDNMQQVNVPTEPTGQIQQPVMSNIQPSKKSGNALKYILIVIGVVIVILLGVLIFTNGKDNKGTKAEPTTVNPEKKQETYKVNYKGFTFKIPTDLVYEVEDNSVLLGDEDGTWASYIEVLEGSFNTLLDRKGQLQSIYQQQGFTSSSAVEKNIGDTSFITLEISKGGQNALLAISKANSMYVFGLTISDIDNEYNYDVLNKLSSILSTAEFNSESNSISSYDKIDNGQILNSIK